MADNGHARKGREDDTGHAPSGGADLKCFDRLARRVPRFRWAAAITAALLGIACLAAACSSSPGGPGNGSSGSSAKLLAYSKCMRGHGLADFPDPKPNGDLTAHAGSRSDLNPNDPAYQSANQACRSLLPGGLNGPASGGDVAAGVKLAECIRSHGFPSFPDPDSRDVFNVTAIDTSSSLFQSALKTCQTQTGVHRAQFFSNGPASP